jgi:hypothetical protein
MTTGELADAKRRALNLLDKWNDVAGVVEKSSGYYYELQSVVEDSVEIGAQAACGTHEQLDGEKI